MKTRSAEGPMQFSHYEQTNIVFFKKVQETIEFFIVSGYKFKTYPLLILTSLELKTI